MLPSLDSATPPTPAQAAAAQAAGIKMWCVYLATKPGVGLLRPWTNAEIEVVRVINPRPIAFYSGWDDPVAIKAAATRLNLRPCLDDESGIRPEGPWVQPNLDAVGGGLYGTSGVHVGRRAGFHIAAWYIANDPGRTWPTNWPTPAAPCGWQWRNSHNEFGVTVDRSWLDDWFGGATMTLSQKYDAVIKAFAAVGLDIVDLKAFLTARTPAVTQDLDYWANQIADDGHNVADVTAKIILDSRTSGNTGKAPDPWKAAPTTVPSGTKLTVTVD